jgi:hypothetical protein
MPEAPERNAKRRETRMLGEEIPGAVYLCQVAEAVSCGACCGLYNLADASRAGLGALLARRAARFAAVPREMAALLAFGAAETAAVAGGLPLPEFHHCPFLGLVGAEHRRVGCLLHPLANGNGGVDFRGLSHYGGLACRVYFCASHRRLPAAVKRLLLAAADNWYDYGLTISDTPLIEALLAVLTRRLGRPLDDGDLQRGGARLRAAAAGLLGLKARWPFRPAGMSLAHDLFAAAALRPPLRYPASAGSSPVEPLLRELGCQPASAAELARAEALVAEVLDGMLRALGVKEIARSAGVLI